MLQMTFGEERQQSIGTNNKIQAKIENMIGGIIGDIVGSIYEFHNIKTKDFPLFTERTKWTDDTILTIATAKWILEGGSASDSGRD